MAILNRERARQSGEFHSSFQVFKPKHTKKQPGGDLDDPSTLRNIIDYAAAESEVMLLCIGGEGSMRTGLNLVLNFRAMGLYNMLILTLDEEVRTLPGTSPPVRFAPQCEERPPTATGVQGSVERAAAAGVRVVAVTAEWPQAQLALQHHVLKVCACLLRGSQGAPREAGDAAPAQRATFGCGHHLVRQPVSHLQDAYGALDLATRSAHACTRARAHTPRGVAHTRRRSCANARSEPEWRPPSLGELTAYATWHSPAVAPAADGQPFCQRGSHVRSERATRRFGSLGEDLASVCLAAAPPGHAVQSVSYTHLRAHETDSYL
eukprot:6206130-Pleurochrysis_carterae.AAC.1